MAQHKVGDRVRIDCPCSAFHGKCASIWRFDVADWEPFSKNAGVDSAVACCVDVDGFGRFDEDGLFAYAPEELKPILPLGSWSALEKMLKTDIRKLREAVEK